MTIIGEETEEYIDASREYGYVQSRDFSGLMIFSDLEGNYFEAYQFDRGEKKRVRLAKQERIPRYSRKILSIVLTLWTTAAREFIPDRESREVAARWCLLQPYVIN